MAAIIIILIPFIIGIVLGVVLKNKKLFFTFLVLDILYILFAPKSLAGYMGTGLMSSIGMKSPAMLLLSAILCILMTGLFLVTCIKQIKRNIKTIENLISKINIGVNVVCLISYVMWLFGIITIIAGAYRVPTIYSIGLFSMLTLITLGLNLFVIEKDLELSNKTKFSPANINLKSKNKEVDYSRYINNQALLNEHLELGILSQEEYQSIIVKQMLENSESNE